MSRLVWDKPTARQAESGIDRGVLYFPKYPRDVFGEYDLSEYKEIGVVWNGLTAFEENAEETPTTPVYFDGSRTLTYQRPSTFSAILRAYTFPDELLDFEGSVSLVEGSFIPNQAPLPFNVCFRTHIMAEDEDFNGYKLHLLYGLTAVAEGMEANTITSSVAPEQFGWSITSKPPTVTGYAPTSHVIINSVEVSPYLLADLEEILYGNDDFDPRIPSPEELLNLFVGQRFIHVIPEPDVNLLPIEAQSGDLVFSQEDVAAYSIDDERIGKNRYVIVVPSIEPEYIPDSIEVGDLVYDESTSILYRWEEEEAQDGGTQAPG